MELTLGLATMLNPKLELGHLTQVLEVLRHGDAPLAIRSWQEQVLEDLV